MVSRRRFVIGSAAAATASVASVKAVADRPVVGTFRAGAAAEVLSLGEGEVFGGWGKTIAEVRPDDRIMVSALVVSDGTTSVCIVSADILLVHNGAVDGQYPQVKQIAERVADLQIDHFQVCATHNHAGPADTDNSEGLLVVAEAAIRAAFARLEEAEVGFGHERASGTTYNRMDRFFFEGHWGARRNLRATGGALSQDEVDALAVHLQDNPEDLVDDTLRLALIRSITGRPIATLINFASHPTSYGPENRALTADYPGIVRRSLKETLGGEVLFLQGAAGDQQPWCGLQVGERALAAARGIAGVLSDQALSIVNSIASTAYARPTEIRYAERTIDAIWPNGVDSRAGTVISPFPVAALRMAEGLTITFTPGEIFASYALDLRKDRRVGAGELLFVGYANDAIGYVPDRILHENYNGSLSLPGPVPNVSFEPNTMFAPADLGERIVAALALCVDDVTA